MTIDIHTTPTGAVRIPGLKPIPLTVTSTVVSHVTGYVSPIEMIKKLREAYVYDVLGLEPREQVYLDPRNGNWVGWGQGYRGEIEREVIRESTLLERTTMNNFAAIEMTFSAAEAPTVTTYPL